MDSGGNQPVPAKEPDPLKRARKATAAGMKRALEGNWRWCVRHRKPLLLTVGITLATAGGVLAIVRAAMLLWSHLDTMAGDDERAQITAVSILVSVIFGIGGLITLALLIHRQVYQARHQRHLEKDATARLDQARDVATDNRHDAAEKRITELYMKAVDQLGHASAAVRLGGLYALDRLGREHNDHRQVIIDVWCSYLRMPYKPSTPRGSIPIGAEIAPPMAPAEQPSDDEHHVRLTAQGLIADHIRDPRPEGNRSSKVPEIGTGFWGAMRIDLTGAHLTDLDLSYCHLTAARFSAAMFDGRTRFSATTFYGRSRFGKATFGSRTRFGKATFHGSAWFGKVTFHGSAWFDEATVHGSAWFDEATFHDDARFDKATFHGSAWFDEVTVHGSAWFDEATFRSNLQFDKATFRSNARFDKTTFLGVAWFDKSTFLGVAWFGEANFRNRAGFRGATFIGQTLFTNAAGLIDLTDSRVRLVWLHVLPPGWQVAAVDDVPGRRQIPAPDADPHTLLTLAQDRS